MSKSYWIAAVALGLILFSASGQAQEHTQGEQGQVQAQQPPAQTLPIPLPVDVIEDEAAAQARKRSEAEARQREIDDLAAQQGMNVATQAINAATQDMRDYAFYSTMLVGIGTLLLVITLFLTRQANRGARAAVDVTRDMGERQLRAYVGVDSARHSVLEWRGGRSTEIKVTFKNYGQTPAYDVQIQAAGDIRPEPGSDPEPLPFNTWIGDAGIPKGILNPGKDFTVTAETQNIEIARGEHFANTLFAFGEVRYNDAFGEKRTTKFRFFRQLNNPHSRELEPCDEGNQAD